MRLFAHHQVDKWRITLGPMGSSPDFGNNGAFLIPCKSATLTVVASDEGGWDHVSVSLPTRCPTWDEMCFIKSLFFDPEETVMQLHPPKSEYVNFHPNCLHLWRPQDARIPLPPVWMVGPKAKGGAQ